MAWLPGDTETSLSQGQKLELQNKAILWVCMNVSVWTRHVILLTLMGSLMLGWISSYAVSAFQFSVILQDSGVEVLPRHPCFIGSYYKAIVIFFSHYSSWMRQHITPFPNQVQLMFPSTSNLSVRSEGKNATQLHIITANQNIFHEENYGFDGKKGI